MCPVRLEAIRPKRQPYYNLDDFSKAVESALDETASKMERQFESTVSTWKNKPRFIRRTLMSVRGRKVSVEVSTNDVIYGYVSGGTKRHVIRPRGNYPLRYRRNFKPKTRVNRLAAQSGGKTGDYVTRWQVNHPGVRARGFEVQIARYHRRHQTLEKAMQRNINRVARSA